MCCTGGQEVNFGVPRGTQLGCPEVPTRFGLRRCPVVEIPRML